MFDISFDDNRKVFDIALNNHNSAFDANFNSIIERHVKDYEQLDNKPSINGVTLVGELRTEDLGIDQTYTHVQNDASMLWQIHHGLGRFPSVTVVDSAGSVVVGGVQYLDENTLTVSFCGAFSGIAYLN